MIFAMRSIDGKYQNLQKSFHTFSLHLLTVLVTITFQIVDIQKLGHFKSLRDHERLEAGAAGSSINCRSQRLSMCIHERKFRLTNFD